MTRALLWEVTTRKLQGSPHTAHTLKVRGQVVRSQLSPYGKEELEALVREHLDRSARGGKNKKYDFGRDGRTDE